LDSSDELFADSDVAVVVELGVLGDNLADHPHFIREGAVGGGGGYKEGSGSF
jgi:hypothetical protein